jgi:hypothetical protein
VVNDDWYHDTEWLIVASTPFVNFQNIFQKLQGDATVDVAFVFQQEVDEHFGAVNEVGGIEQIDPFFVFAGTEERFPGVLERIESELGEQFGWELGSEQSAGMVDHIESASSKMIVRIYGVVLVHHLNGL